MTQSPILLVDASIYIFRSYFSIPSSFFAANGELVNAVYGYTQFLLDLLDEAPTHMSIAFDESLVSCYRNRIYPDYKANRDLPDENLKFQLARCQEITGLLGMHNVTLYDYEADDIIGTVQKQISQPVTIVTRDKDLGQLLGPEDMLWDFAARETMGPDEVCEKFGVRPDQIADYLALAGDAVDNIPGAPGIGAKTAAVLLNEFGSIEGVYTNMDRISQIGLRGAARIEKSLTDNRELVQTFQQITRICCEVPISVSLEDLEPGAPDLDGVLRFCDEMAFGNRIRDRVSQLGKTV